MHFLLRVWTSITTIIGGVGLPSISDYGNNQQPIGGNTHVSVDTPIIKPQPPRFRPPGSNLDHFKCDYSAMGPDWVRCDHLKAGCWLLNTKTNKEYNISTDYENDGPIGITRNYFLNVTEGNIVDADGILFDQARLFNKTFPGPLIEACWGDRVNITVINHMPTNGTSIHWHGIRQLHSTNMDGVNGITQCPIATGDSYSYVWNATQYGSSWYHSHYSVQYADGLQGPITLHGPTSIPFDEAVEPLIISDWLHNSAFNATYIGTDNATLLLGGVGNCSNFYTFVPQNRCHEAPPIYTLNFNEIPPNPETRARRYLLRIINTSYGSSLFFAIDNHHLTVVEADFVPVQPKQVTSILVAIGQRYHVVVEAKPPIPGVFDYWIRTSPAGCFDDVKGNTATYNQTGILRYNGSTGKDPTTKAWQVVANCQDDLTMQLQTTFNWTVTAPKNNGGKGQMFNVSSVFTGTNQYALANWALQPPSNGGLTPFQTIYGNPTFLNLDNIKDSWPTGWMVVSEDYTADDYVYLILQGHGHPIHLHGHDFAVLDYQPHANFNGKLNYPYQSPMRRDVILLPPGNSTHVGYVVIAFKTDNPGTWLMHCHIAFHASGGLSLQIMERQGDANKLWPPGQSDALIETRRVCMNWNSWAYDCRNYWPGNVNTTESPVYPACDDATMVQNDSGV